jgi:hypothetical protein
VSTGVNVRFLRVAVLTGLVLSTLSLAAQAAPVSVNFCPGDPTCPLGVTEASLTFVEIANSDPNDYYLYLVLRGNDDAPHYVDEVSFKIGSAKTEDYEALPSLISAPVQGSPWQVFFDNVSASAGSCISNTGQQQAVCSQSGPGDLTNYGAELKNTVNSPLTWVFLVDLKDSEGAIGLDDGLNMRVQFLNKNGKNAGILSPDGRAVPEPTTFALLGTGLAALFAAQSRRRKR